MLGLLWCDYLWRTFSVASESRGTLITFNDFYCALTNRHGYQLIRMATGQKQGVQLSLYWPTEHRPTCPNLMLCCRDRPIKETCDFLYIFPVLKCVLPLSLCQAQTKIYTLAFRNIVLITFQNLLTYLRYLILAIFQ